MMREQFERCSRVLICMILGATFLFVLSVVALIWEVILK
jgi:hypothetical protein